MKTGAIAFACIIILLLCWNCVATREFTGQPADLKDEFVITGKIEVIPPLRGEELSGPKDGILLPYYAHTCVFALDERILRQEDVNINNLDFLRHFVKVDLGKPFFVKQKCAAVLFLSAASVPTVTGSIRLPGVFSFRVTEGCRIVYLGTIRYYRDSRNAITRIDILDESAEARKAVEARFKTETALCPVELTFAEE